MNKRQNRSEQNQTITSIPPKTVAPTTGKSFKSLIVYSVLSAACAAGIFYVVRKFKAKNGKVIEVKAVEYVFFNTDGKPVILSEEDVYGIKQMNEDGVLPSAIGEHYNLSTVMVSRVINLAKSLGGK